MRAVTQRVRLICKSEPPEIKQNTRKHHSTTSREQNIHMMLFGTNIVAILVVRLPSGYK